MAEPQQARPTDAELARLIRAGASGAAEAERELCTRLLPRIRVFFARWQADPYTIEDSSHDALIHVLVGVREGRVDDPTKVGSYALGICRNKVNSSVRRNQRRHRALLRTQADELHEIPLPRLRMGRLEECLHFLREHDRTLLRLAFCEGRSASATGAVLGLAAQAVRVRRHRVIEKLRRCLGVKGYAAQR